MDQDLLTLSFRDYQNEALKTDTTIIESKEDIKNLMVPLLGIAGETGTLLTEFKKWLRDGDRYRPFRDQVSEELGDILWYLANIASKWELDLEEIANENLAKVHEIWGDSSGGRVGLFGPDLHRYDTGFPSDQKLPREIRVEFCVDVNQDGQKQLKLISGGRQLGDPLTDNSHFDDGYRYHDVFHLTNMILLNWSPVMRKLLNCKRKANSQIDEVEDGARAGIIEEAISAVTFGYAERYCLFEGATSVGYDLIRTVREMAKPFEVRDRIASEWQHSILEGFRIWRLMIKNEGGVFIGNADAHTIDYELPSS
ncbi:nucleoside triphosphate pyrophosphohydrolase family protein [Calycomorphotria hydatis]|uniref:MazG nucleotide pyrophosphohydrolase domain protein n=1 Tax=Calycomorphotria hydatis TaxID=2528027 RepID=A0A517TDM4_9PLAN|nr:nucleoside triphosphate pyrophosphohydrolase family protein [Calycomorphotria hydatis]QDT66478.1 MazG nucleotide pyrophosphohydrolase domain protein [Calycomorphotria hydatis]